ncbi:MAG: hypothetical protein QXL15_05255, partial [Candidatus Korarchaeota archaeon]
IIICEDMRSLILFVAFLHQEDITTNDYLNLSILKQLQEAFPGMGIRPKDTYGIYFPKGIKKIVIGVLWN